MFLNRVRTKLLPHLLRVLRGWRDHIDDRWRWGRHVNIKLGWRRDRSRRPRDRGECPARWPWTGGLIHPDIVLQIGGGGGRPNRRTRNAGKILARAEVLEHRVLLLKDVVVRLHIEILPAYGCQALPLRNEA